MRGGLQWKKRGAPIVSRARHFAEQIRVIIPKVFCLRYRRPESTVFRGSVGAVAHHPGRISLGRIILG